MGEALTLFHLNRHVTLASSLNCIHYFWGMRMSKALAIDLRIPVVVAVIILSFPGKKTLAQGSPFPHPVITENAGKMHIVVRDARPLAQVITLLQEKYAWRINYEDPQYTSKLDYTQMKNDQGERRIPGGGDFTVDFPAGSAPDTSPDQAKTLQLIVDAYNQTNNPGRFELRHKTPEQFDIVATAAHDAQGKISPQPAALDVSINLPSEQREFAETMNLICQKISEKAHAQVTLGVYPITLMTRPVTAGGKEQTARDYVLASVDATGRRLCWGLLFDPESATYVLNLHQIKKPPPPPPVQQTPQPVKPATPK
jgi:hypothetical protein